MSGQRISRIADHEVDDAARAMFEVFSGGRWKDADQNHVLQTFAHHPTLATPFLAFNVHLLSTSTLPVLLRQIAILRTAWVRRCPYMWASHLRTSLMVGLSGDEFEPVKHGAAHVYWSVEERTILRATDMLLATSDIDDAMWTDLSTVFDRQQILDFLFTVGAYQLLAGAFNALRIEQEAELQELVRRYGGVDVPASHDTGAAA